MLKTWKYFLFRVSGNNIDIELCILHGGRPPEERDGAGESRDGVAEGCRECHQRQQHPGREGVLVDGVAPQQEEAEYVWGDRVHATVPER